jgi:hypothetical protein
MTVSQLLICMPYVKRRFIKDQDARIGQDGAGDAQELLLPLEQITAALRQRHIRHIEAIKFSLNLSASQLVVLQLHGGS